MVYDWWCFRTPDSAHSVALTHSFTNLQQPKWRNRGCKRSRKPTENHRVLLWQHQHLRWQNLVAGWFIMCSRHVSTALPARFAGFKRQVGHGQSLMNSGVVCPNVSARSSYLLVQKLLFSFLALGLVSVCCCLGWQLLQFHSLLRRERSVRQFRPRSGLGDWVWLGTCHGLSDGQPNG